MVVLGRITAPYGVKGWLKLHPFGDDPASWSKISRWWLGSDDTDFSTWRACALQFLRPHGKGWVVKLAGVDDRSAAEALTGQYFGAPRAALPQTEPDEFYWADLLGLKVINAAGESLGCVIEMIESGAHAVMVVVAGDQADRTERLLPFVEHVVKEVDVPGGVIHVDWECDW
jgi:16S rRNA processing protein RimM